MTALSNRQRRQKRKATPKRSAPKPSSVEAVIRSERPADVKAELEARQAHFVDVAVAQDAAAGLGVGRKGPVDLKAAVQREFGVEHVRTPFLPGVPFRTGGRDGLIALHKTRTVTDVELKAGLAFRLAYEAAAQGIGSCLGKAGEGGGSRRIAGLARSAAELQRAYLLARLNQMERAVGAAMLDGRELHALRLIAGEGQTVREVAGSSGFARAATTAALVRALEAISKALRITGQ